VGRDAGVPLSNDRYLRLYTNPPDDIAAGYVEDL
jgi:hypothetical protein